MMGIKINFLSVELYASHPSKLDQSESSISDVDQSEVSHIKTHPSLTDILPNQFCNLVLVPARDPESDCDNVVML